MNYLRSLVFESADATDGEPEEETDAEGLPPEKSIDQIPERLESDNSVKQIPSKLAVYDVSRPTTRTKMAIVNQYHKAVFVTMSALAAGTVMSWNIVGGTLPSENISFPTSVVTANSTVVIKTQFVYSWLIRLNYIGAMIGVIPTAFSAQQFGRRLTVIVFFMLFVLSWVLKIVGDMEMMITGMIVGGISIGAVSAVVPMYLCELADNNYRGSTGSTYFAMFVLGQLITQATSKLSYIWYTSVPLFFPPIFLLTVALAPESPPFLLYRQQPIEAEKALCCLREGDIKDEFQEMSREMTELSDRGNFVKEIAMTNAGRRGFFISLILMIFLGLSGAAQIQQFVADFYGIRDYYYINLGNLATQIVFSLLAGRFSDLIGKRILFIISAIMMSLCLIALGIYYRLGSDLGSLIPAKIFVFVFILGYSLGFGPLPWIIIMELLSINVKWIGCSLAITIYWLVECLFHDLFMGDIEEIVGKDVFVWIVASFCALAAIFVFLFVPETKKLTSGEVRETLQTRMLHCRTKHNTMNLNDY